MKWKEVLKNATLDLKLKIKTIFRRQLTKLPTNKLHSKKSHYSGIHRTKEGDERRAGGETAHLSMEEIQRMGFGWVEKLKIYPTKYAWEGHYEMNNSEMLKGNKKLGELVEGIDEPEVIEKLYYTMDEDYPVFELGHSGN